MNSIEDLVLDGGHVYTDLSGPPGVGRTRLLLCSVKKYLNQPGNEKAYALIIDTNGDLNLHDTGDEKVMERVKYIRVLSLTSFLATMIALPAHIDSQPFDTKLIAIDTISNYIRYPDMKQSEKMSVMNSTKKAINKLNNDMFIKVISTSDAILRKVEDTFVGQGNPGLENNHYIGPFFGSHFYQSLKFRQLQIYYEPGNPRTRILKALGVNPDPGLKFTIDNTGSIKTWS